MVFSFNFILNYSRFRNNSRVSSSCICSPPPTRLGVVAAPRPRESRDVKAKQANNGWRGLIFAGGAGAASKPWAAGTGGRPATGKKQEWQVQTEQATPTTQPQHQKQQQQTTGATQALALPQDWSYRWWCVAGGRSRAWTWMDATLPSPRWCRTSKPAFVFVVVAAARGNNNYNRTIRIRWWWMDNVVCSCNIKQDKVSRSLIIP